jgi:arylformamidase
LELDPAIIAGWEADAAQFRDAAGGELGLSYGPHERTRTDIFRSKEDHGGAHAVFIHGGYWQNLDRAYFSHLAQGLEFHGIPMAVPSYPLCPQVSVADIVADMQRFCLWLWKRSGRRLVVAGHSAGGHLAACMAATEWPALGGPARLVTGGLGISGIYDLRPLIPTSINKALKLDEKTARAVSPLCWPAPHGVRFEAWVGGQESPEYLRQTTSLEAAWRGSGIECSSVVADGSDHFTVVAPLAQPESPMTLALAALCDAA